MQYLSSTAGGGSEFRNRGKTPADECWHFSGPQSDVTFKDDRKRAVEALAMKRLAAERSSSSAGGETLAGETSA